MQFKSAQEMYNTLSKGQDLYNPALQIYIWQYSDSNGTDGESIAVHYHLSPIEAEKYSKKSKENDSEYWGAYFGPGDPIYDNPLKLLEELYEKPGWVIANENYTATNKDKAKEIAEWFKFTKNYTIEECCYVFEVTQKLKGKPFQETAKELEKLKPDALTEQDWYLLISISLLM